MRVEGAGRPLWSMAGGGGCNRGPRGRRAEALCEEEEEGMK